MKNKETLDCPFDFTSRCTMGSCDCKPKQETPEKAAERILEENYAYKDDSGDRVYYDTQVKECIVNGAKWQQERMYSEEDMISFATFYYTHQGKATEYWGKDLFKIWFEQFKKK
jgi:hypothetical protein